MTEDVLTKTGECVVCEEERQNLKIASDREYLEEYFKICELLNEKYDLLNPEASKMSTAETKKREEIAKQRAEDLRAIAQAKEKVFWSAIKDSLDKGRKFVMEDIASAYGLEIFEKRVLLFLLHRQFISKLDGSFCKLDIPKVLDSDNSIIDRICNLRYLDSAGRLLQANLVTKRNFCDAIVISLSAKAIDIFSKMLRGEEVELHSKETGRMASYEEIGYIKEPEYTIDNVVLEKEIKSKIQLFIDSSKKSVAETDGIFKVGRIGKKMVFLLYGPPGTGKSMLAEAIASMLGKKMLVVEYPKITSRWFGETDKKISQSFKSAKENSLVLLMDEADSLLYNRNYAGQEHDIRFVNEMLQELDRFEGVAVLTTNMDTLLDPAVERRITLRVKLEEPNERMRAQIWKAHIPSQIKLAADVDFAILAKRYDFSGGYIRNAVQVAIRKITLDNKDTISMEDLLFGADVEKEGIFNKQKRAKIGFFATQ